MSNKPRFVGEKVRLGELISKAKVERCGDRSFPVYSMTMHDGIVEQAGRFKKAIASKDTSSYKVVKKNQLVVGFPIDEGVIYVQNFEAPGIMSPAYNVWDINLEKVNPAYLELALHSPQSMAYYADKMHGTTARRRTLTASGLCDMQILLPAMGRQLEIVESLAEVKAQSVAAEAQIEKLDQLVKSRFVEMFGDVSNYEARPLVDCVAGIESGKSPKCMSNPRVNGGPAVLKLSAISSGVYLEAENKALLPDDEVAPQKVVVDGDILLSRKNTPELVGRSVLVDHTDGNVMFPDIVFRMHVRPGVNAVYLSQLLSGPLLGSIRSLAHGSAKSMSNIPKSELAMLEIPLPPLELQQEFADFAAQVDKSRFVARQQIEKLQTLYDSLAQDYFGD